MCMRGNKRILLSIVLALGLIGTGYAVWNASTTGRTTLAITQSDNPIQFTSSFDVNSIDMTGQNNAVIVSDSIEVANEQRGRSAFVDVECSTNSVDADPEDECVLNGTDVYVVVSEDFFLAPGETKNVWVNYTVDPWACYGNVTVDCDLFVERYG